jgi:hypothetical protein
MVQPYRIADLQSYTTLPSGIPTGSELAEISNAGAGSFQVPVAVLAGSRPPLIVATGGTVTASPTQYGNIVVTTTSAVTINLPSILLRNGVPLSIVARTISEPNITIVPFSGQTVLGGTSTLITDAYGGLTLTPDSASLDWYTTTTAPSVAQDFVVPVLNDTSQAANNTTRINAALTAGGTIYVVGNGVAYINVPLIIGSNTRLVVDQGLTLRGYPSPTSSNMIQTAAFQRTATTVSMIQGTAAAFTASISGTTLNVSAVSSGTLMVGSMVGGAGVAGQTTILALGSGTGGTGTYTVNNSQTVGPEAMTSDWGNLSATVNWTNHGLAIDDVVWIQGTAQTTNSAYSGVFKVLSVAPNTFAVSLRRIPGAAPSGTIQARKGDQNIIIQGGTWDINGSTQSSSYLCHNILIAGVYRLTIQDVTWTSSSTNFGGWGIAAGAINGFEIKNVAGFIGGTTSSPLGNRDSVHINGPAFDGNVEGVRGTAHDDFFALAPQEYLTGQSSDPGDYTGGGDILNITASHIEPSEYSAAQVAHIFPRNGFVIDGIVIEKSRTAPTNNAGLGTGGTPFYISTDGLQTTAVVGSIIFRDIQLLAPQPSNPCIDVAASEITINYLEYSNFSMPAAPATFSTTLLSVGNVTKIRTMVVRQCEILFSTAGYTFFTGKNIDNLTFRDNQIVATGSVGIGCVMGNGIIRALFEGNQYTGTNQFVSLNTGVTSTPLITFSNNRGDCAVGINLQSSATLNVFGNLVNATQYFVQVDNTSNANTSNIYGSGNVLSAGTFVHLVNGSETVGVFGFDIHVDVSLTSRVNGAYCYNTNAGLGTLGAAGMVINQGGAGGGTWKLVANTALNY